MDYHSIIAIIKSKFKPFLIEQVEALVLAHEARMNKLTKQTLSNSPSINYLQAHHKSLVISSDGYTIPNKPNQKFSLLSMVDLAMVMVVLATVEVAVAAVVVVVSLTSSVRCV